jgi:REP element-mobilizing transposase RayT
MESPEQRRPSLTPSFPLSSQETSRVATNAESPEPHLGWHSRGYLPHWDHPGMIQSVNFRLGDSLPAAVVKVWREELGLLQGKRGRAGSATVPVASSASRSPSATRRRDAGAPGETELRRRIEKYLDAGHGECWLRRPDIARLTEEALMHFDGQRYRLLAWCIMPNHVHVLIETQVGFPLDDFVHSWKSFTSHKANALLMRRGEFWQRDYHDRYVRNAEHYEQVVAYIEENPVKAGLAKVKIDWPWSSARFRKPGSAAVPAAS